MLKYLQTITPGSGGQAFYNTNDLNDSLARVVNNGSHFYSLTYSPTNSNVDGKYRRIQVTLIRGKDTLALAKTSRFYRTFPRYTLCVQEGCSASAFKPCNMC